MIEWLYRIFVGHNHKWRVLSENVTYEGTEVHTNVRPLGMRYTVQCEHCGKIKAFNNY